MNKFLVFAVLAVVLPAAIGKISPALQEQLKLNSNIDVFISLKESVQPRLKAIQSKTFSDRGTKLNSIASSLKTFTKISQASLLKFLKTEAPELEVEQFWITNRIFVKNVPVSLVHKLAQHPDVDEVHENAQYSIDTPTGTKHSVKNEDLTYGLKLIGVEEAWNQGYDGTGVKIGIIDTGVRHTHESMRSGFATEYGWYDAFNKEEIPYDGQGHGTHVAGTAAGTNNIGVAKGATHMHCAAFDRNGFGQTRTILRCGEFMACPTRFDDSEPDCSQAPQIVSNSWGGGYSTAFQEMVESWNAAGIIGVFAAGNSGFFGCGSIGYPAGYTMDLISVGNTDENDSLARSSSRGPARSGNTKPEISAPGTNVLSADSRSDTGYMTLTGTSMAAPHVAGAVAILLQANPNFIFNQIAQALYVSANTNVRAPSENCGGISETTIPNNSFGHGRLSVSEALKFALKHKM